MTPPTGTTDFELYLRQLAGIEADLRKQLDRERSGQPLETAELAGARAALEPEVERIRGAVHDVEGWTQGMVPLERIAGAAAENLDLARRGVEGARDAEQAGHGHEMLHRALDGVFHARRCVEELRQLEEQARETLREVDRIENRRDFLSG